MLQELEASVPGPEDLFRRQVRGIITRFGGSPKLSSLTGIKVSTINNWPATGIPPWRHERLRREARGLGISLSQEELDELSTTSRKNGRRNGG